MKFAHKSGIVWKIYLIKLYICSTNCPNAMFWIASMAPLSPPHTSALVARTCYS